MKPKTPISKYRRVEKPPKETEANEMRIKANNKPFGYMVYVAKLLFDDEEERIFLNATGPATSNAVRIVEELRRNITSKRP